MAKDRRIAIQDDVRAALMEPSTRPRTVTLNGRTFTPEETIGSGFKSVVWRAVDERARDRALKLALYDDYRKRSYQSELSRAARLEPHPVFARLEDAGRTEIALPDGTSFDCVLFVEEYVSGLSLRQFLGERPEDATASFLLAYVKATSSSRRRRRGRSTASGVPPL